MMRTTSSRNFSSSWKNRKVNPAKRITFLAGSAVLLAALIWLVQVGWQSWQGGKPAVVPPSQDVAVQLKTLEGQGNENGTAQTVMPLRLPPGFSINIFAQNLDGPRVLVQDAGGTVLVSLTKAGKVVALPDKDADGTAEDDVTVVAGLNKPQGMAFQPTNGHRLYIAAADELVAFDYDSHNHSVRNPKQIAKLPPEGKNDARSLLFTSSTPGRLLISIGSSGDVGEEKDWRYGKIVQVNPETKEMKPFAAGLPNTPGMAQEPGTGRILATAMGRDCPGNDVPLDALKVISAGQDCGRQGQDGQFDQEGVKKAYGARTDPSLIDLPADSAPVGLAFIPATGWPKEYQGNLLVAYHGSENRPGPTGGKIVRLKPDGQGGYGPPEDFITGWLSPDNRALGRPVEILALPNGVLYIADDQAGVVYRVVYVEPKQMEPR